MTRIFLVFFFVAASAAAAPRWVRISLPPTDPSTAMVVSWNTDASPDDNEVQFGISPTSLSGTATGASFAAKGSLGVVHEVTLTGLVPSTHYYYRVGGNGDYSAVHDFETAPADACTPFTFIASGDHRSDDDAGPNPKWKGILGEMVATGATFILETGDLVKDGEDIKQWWNHMEMGAVHMGEIALMPSFGNHDSDNVTGAAAAFNQLFSLPTNESTGTEDFYAFTYGNAVFVALSTATYDEAAGLTTQAEWLDQTLAKYADKTWKFVYFHHPCHTSYVDLGFADLNHPPNEKGQNAAFIPVFDKHHVDIVFAGHNHFYERFSPMKAGSPASSTEDGTVYVTTGGAGAFTYDEIDLFGFKLEPMGIICGDGILGIAGGKAKGSQLCSGKHHYVEVSIDDHVLTATVRATQEQNLSSGPQNVAVIDTFTIEKPESASTCQSPTKPDSDGTDGDTGTPAVAEANEDAGGPVAEPTIVESDPTAPDAAAVAEPIEADVATVADSTTSAEPASQPDVGGLIGGGPDLGGGPGGATGTASTAGGDESSGCATGRAGAVGPSLVLMLVLGLSVVAPRTRGRRAGPAGTRCRARPGSCSRTSR